MTEEKRLICGADEREFVHDKIHLMSAVMKLRYWLVSKMIKGLRVEVYIEPSKADWIKDQLDKGNSIMLEYKINRID